MLRPRERPAARSSRADVALVVAALALVVADAAVSLRGVLGPPAPGGVVPGWVPPLRATVACLLLVALARVLARRGALAGPERPVWQRFSQGLRCAALGVGVQAVVDAATALGEGPTHPLLALPFLVSTLGACALVYRGLITWNRVRTALADTSDWLNGISAVLVVAAIGLLVATTTGAAPREGTSWQGQLWLLRLGAGVVLLGAAATVVFLTSRRLDLRRALVLAAPAVLLTGTALDVVGPLRTGYAETATWVVAGALLVAAVVVVPRETEARPATTQEATIGSAVVLGVAVVVLLCGAVSAGPSGPSAWYAFAAVLGSGVRVWHVIRDLAHLATTRQQALTDDLTGIANRRALMSHLDAHPEAGRALLVLDLDRFKEVNDRWGHGAGDELLRVVAGRLRAALPPEAVLARLGGDEFAIVDRDRDGGRGAAARAVEALAAPALVAGHRIALGVSVGVADSGWAGAPLTTAELLRRADAAMYVAKAAGGSRAQAYDGEVDAAARRRVELGEDLRAALSGLGSGELVVHYQPQLAVRGGAASGVEALVRYRHPRLGLVPPDDFLPLVEELGLMAELTAKVITRAAADSELWWPTHPLRLAVNLSASCLARPELVPLVEGVLARHPGLADRLVLEVTETAIMADPEVALAAMHLLSARSVQFSIDDYGTGFASLAYLHDLPAVELKLDRSFTARIRHDRRTVAIVAGTVELAHQLGMRLVAEGVEDAETLAVLADLGCDETQGYLHARPVPADDLVHWLTAHRPAPSEAAAAAAPAVPLSVPVLRRGALL